MPGAVCHPIAHPVPLILFLGLTGPMIEDRRVIWWRAFALIGTGFAMVMIGGKSDSEKNGYHFYPERVSPIFTTRPCRLISGSTSWFRILFALSKERRMQFKWFAAFLLAGLMVSSASAQDKSKTTIINDFETDADLQAVDVHAAGAKLVTEGVTHGSKALEITLDPKSDLSYISVKQPPSDWSGYDALILDVTNQTGAPLPAGTLIGDKAWQQKMTYWNRHNGSATFAPGKTTWTIPVQGMYRGEAGSRNNDIKRNIDPDSIVVLNITFGAKGLQGKVVVDNLRLVKADRPQGVWAFDFGPEDQAVMLGWTPVSSNSVYNAQKGFGFNAVLYAGSAWDTTFGPAMLRDGIECGGQFFRVNVPQGQYRVTVFYENSGYWDGQQAMQSQRIISVDGKTAWQEKRPEGAMHYLTRFENVEPIGVDIWDTYMAGELAKPAVFEATAGSQGLALNFEADRPLGSRVAGVVICRADDNTATAWVKQQMDAMATEFRSAAVALDKPAQAFQVGEDWQKLGLVAWPVDLQTPIKPTSVPSDKIASPATLQVSRLAVMNEYEPLCVAIRPLKDLGTCSLRIEGSPEGIDARTQVIWYNTSRGFGSIAYTIQPHTVRDQASVNLPKDITREVVVNCHITDKAKAGDAKLTLIVEDAAKATVLRVPLTLNVHNIKLDRKSDYQMGFFGIMPPGAIPANRQQAVLEQTMQMLSEHGMNYVCGAPSFTLKGWKNGNPIIDFAATDAFIALAQKNGFTGPLSGYGGPGLAGSSDGDVAGQAAKRVAAESGMPYEQALTKAWAVVDEHARKANWPLIQVKLCDEPRVAESAKLQVEYMTIMSKISKQFPKSIRTTGYYSATFSRQPKDKNDMLYWEQEIFRTLDASSLNSHDQSVMDEAVKLGKEVHVYNQGKDRYSWGLYQWSEYSKGVKSRLEWHMCILSGYQFFDLDAREPDFQAVCYGKDKVYPSVMFENAREGAEDFYLCQMLGNLAKSGAGSDAAKAKAKAVLDELAKPKVGDRRKPANLDIYGVKAQVVEAIEAFNAPVR